MYFLTLLNFAEFLRFPARLDRRRTWVTQSALNELDDIRPLDNRKEQSAGDRLMVTSIAAHLVCLSLSTNYFQILFWGSAMPKRPKQTRL